MSAANHRERAKEHSRQEQTIDEMVEDTLPASDATQLPGRAAGAPEPGAEQPDPKREFQRPPPSTIGNQGVAPSTRMQEETVALGGDATVTFRVDADARRLSLTFSEDGMMLDAEALDRLIEALSKQRARMAD
jgi:hypothetical protein